MLTTADEIFCLSWRHKDEVIISEDEQVRGREKSRPRHCDRLQADSGRRPEQKRDEPRPV
jgi:hypothetical protein